jgi:hypothetical protein
MVVDQTMGFHTKYASGEGQQRSKKTWKAPLMGQAKLNVDGAYSIDGGAGIGMLLRDHQGAIIMAACRELQHCRDATEA